MPKGPTDCKDGSDTTSSSSPSSPPLTAMASTPSANAFRAPSASRPPTSSSAPNAPNNHSAGEGKKDALCGRGKPTKPPVPRGACGGGGGSGGGTFRPADLRPGGGGGSNNGRRSNNGSSHKRLPHQRSAPPASLSSLVTQTGVDVFEVGSVHRLGGKKRQQLRSLNHELNFQFEPRGPRRGRGHHGGYMGRKRNGNYDVSNARPYKKEHYLQANCQFVVKASGDYTVQLTNPDEPVEWEQVEQVVLKSSAGVPSCPICLYPPKAAKVAKCGHVFCWACILHYLALSDQPERKCPICYQDIQKKDLKSVVSLLHSDIQVGHEIEMKLMRRERNSLFAIPVDQYHPDVNAKHPSLIHENNTYSQLLTATVQDVADVIIARERRELEEQYRAEKDEPEACFIEEAFKLLSERVSQMFEGRLTSTDALHGLKDDMTAKEEKLEGACAILQEREETGFSTVVDEIICPDRPRHISSSSDGESSVEVLEDEGEDFSAADLDISSVELSEKNRKGSGGQQQPKETFYFYQSSDGQSIFLHALNVQMLVKEYGSLERCPKVIRGRILERDTAVMTEELRQKLRYLRHLPVTASFEVCEIELSESLVSQDTLAEFQAQTDARHRRRQRRARDERRREKKIQLEQNKLLGQFPGRTMRIESEFHFPKVGSSSSLLATKPSSRLSSESLDSNPPLSTSPSHNVSTDPVVVTPGTLVAPLDNVTSFAKMVRMAPKPSASSTQQQQQLRRSETFPTAITGGEVRRGHQSDSEPEPEDYVPPPPQATIGDTLALALERAAIQQVDEEVRGKKKKKKSKGTKISLTGAPRPLA